ncbi:hypothetical protein AB4Z22_13560, partial [Paenibacillus sp. TAF58]
MAFQEELYKRFSENAGEALLFLGFSERSLSTSDSLRYLRLVASSYVKKLAESPDLELLRDKIAAELEAGERKHLLDSVPYLIGAVHLNDFWLEQAWAKLNHSFSTVISGYKGSVEQFLTSMNPNVHLVGRVFFHLVESGK